MKKVVRTTLITLGTASAWGLLMASLWRPYQDPLTGFGPGGYVGLLFFQVGMAVFSALFFCTGLRLPATILAAIALFSGSPMPSKSGIDVLIINETETAAQITISRTKDSKRCVVFRLPPSQSVQYRTAPGDYSETNDFLITDGQSRFFMTVAALRRNELRITQGGLLPVVIQNLESQK